MGNCQIKSVQDSQNLRQTYGKIGQLCILIYSFSALHDKLPDEHLKYWELLVLACRIRIQPFISPTDLNKADLLLLNFCCRIEQTVDSEVIRPNMHLHCHLTECIQDDGPIHAFWCYAFEKMQWNLRVIPQQSETY